MTIRTDPRHRYSRHKNKAQTEELIMGRIITISRQYGSGGSEIGRKVAKALDIPYYDRTIIDVTAKES